MDREITHSATKAARRGPAQPSGVKPNRRAEPPLRAGELMTGSGGGGAPENDIRVKSWPPGDQCHLRGVTIRLRRHLTRG